MADPMGSKKIDLETSLLYLCLLTTAVTLQNCLSSKNRGSIFSTQHLALVGSINIEDTDVSRMLKKTSTDGTVVN